MTSKPLSKNTKFKRSNEKQSLSPNVSNFSCNNEAKLNDVTLDATFQISSTWKSYAKFAIIKFLRAKKREKIGLLTSDKKRM